MVVDGDYWLLNTAASATTVMHNIIILFSRLLLTLRELETEISQALCRNETQTTPAGCSNVCIYAPTLFNNAYA